MRRKLQTKRGRQRYALRMATVEPVFGQTKQGRGFRQFLLRGLEKVNRERSLICTGHKPAEAVPFRWAASRQRPPTVHPHRWVFAGATFNQGNGVITSLSPLVSGPVRNPQTGC